MSGLVSIIIPVHGRFDLAVDSIWSAAKQVYEPVEMIIIDDASPSVFQLPADLNVSTRRVLLHRSEKNLGPGGARELGRTLANGEYFCYLDSDDLLHPRMIAKSVQALQNHPGKGMSYCITEILDLNSVQARIRPRSDLDFGEFLPIILDGRPWATGSCVWTREATEKIGPWSDGWIWEDYEYDVRAGCLGIEIVHVPEILYKYRVTSKDHLSSMDQELRNRYKGDSLVLIAKNLDEAGCLKNDVILNRLQELLYTNFIQQMSFRTSIKNPEIPLWLKKISETDRKRLWISATILLAELLPSNLAAAVSRKLRIRYFRS